jgi:wyosine [tRNA(Phe)-imidazoG37] synthetase (radical SAM superfamily)
MRTDRTDYYEPIEVCQDVKTKIMNAVDMGEKIDYLTFVPDGEPTMDINLGIEIEKLKQLDYKIAVITNASLIHLKDVRDELVLADWVSLKVDTVTQRTWKKINRPYKKLNIDEILSGISKFAGSFNGDLVTETMLIRDMNDNVDELGKVARFISGLNTTKSYISIPIRPPAEKWVEPPNENLINFTFQHFLEKGINVELLVGSEGNTFAFTGNFVHDLLSIISVHPMREDSIVELLAKAGEGWEIIENLINEQKIVETRYKNKKFYLKKIQAS